MKKLLLCLSLFVPILFTGTSCRRELKYTSVQIKDSLRHYYPIKRGQHLDIMFKVTNVGNEPLIIYDIQPSCGCILVDKSEHVVIPEHRSRMFHATYDSNKNIGEVKHHIRIFGNIFPARQADMTFLVNVVPEASYTRDYEELYQKEQGGKGTIRRMVDGTEAERGYYTEE
ncbi:MAG: DUF1573 domain-containing protein [Mediterranea sp.]|jgi:hypothetical protein|nr:DUF1573 domain-containing protein [Mediterranea sp.]